MKIEVIQTIREPRAFFDKREISEYESESKADYVIEVLTEQRDQKMIGFGGAFTDTAAGALLQMDENLRNEAMRLYFDPKNGLAYNAGRIPIGACDFSRNLYSLCEEPDRQMKDFSVQRDVKGIIPFVHEANHLAGDNELFLIALPWSPPAWMKTNNSMLEGGHLREDCYNLIAEYIAKFVDSYEQEGIHIQAVSGQNEPDEVQKWPSCIYTADEEVRLVEHMIKIMSDRGVKTLCWDSNKDLLPERLDILMKKQIIADRLFGAAFHWYSGGYYENLQSVHAKYPQLTLCATECCVVIPEDLDDWSIGEKYAADIIGDLINGTSLWLDWNLFLDEESGPKIFENPCAAPVMLDKKSQKIIKLSSYYYIGHFSRYIHRGAVRLRTTVERTLFSQTIKDQSLACEHCVFENPDGEIVIVLLNRQERSFHISVRLKDVERCIMVPSHSILSVRVWRE